MTIVSVQSFGIASPGGGRVMRALFADAPEPVVNVCMTPERPPRQQQFNEWHLRPRPNFGRLERTRLWPCLDALVPVANRSVVKKLAALAQEQHATRIHTVAHNFAFWPALLAARRLEVPYFLTAHDHLRYTLRGHWLQALALRWLGEAWREADHRFVISEALARDYNATYGERPFTVVTDGFDEEPLPYQPRPSASVRVYFAGAFHLAYGDNLRAVLGALERLTNRVPGRNVSFTCRCGSLAAHALETTVPIEVLPFAEESQVDADIEEADVLYLPLPFGDRYSDFNRFSLSTKAVTYLRSGRPILYHGPTDSAIGELLAKHDAAIAVSSLEPREIADALEEGLRGAPRLAENARDLARSTFSLEQQRARFWTALRSNVA